MRKQLLLIALVAVVGVAAVLMLLLQRRCTRDGGAFEWFTATCATGGPPVILQGDIHRV